MEIRIHNMKNLSEKQQAKIKITLHKGGFVLDSHIWSSRIENTLYTESRGFSGKDIVAMVRSGSHDGGTVDNILDINIAGFFKYSNTVGYTYLGSAWQWINKRFLDRYKESSIFSHVIHESMHRCFRFVHNKKHSTSVPYKVGYLSGKAYEEYYRVHDVPTGFVESKSLTITYVD